MPVQIAENKNIKRTEYRPVAGLIGCGLTGALIGFACILPSVAVATNTISNIVNIENPPSLVIGAVTAALMAISGGIAGWFINKHAQDEFYAKQKPS